MEAHEVVVVGERCNSNMKQLLIARVEKRRGVTWRRERLFNTVGEFGRISDPHEKKSVYVGRSSLPRAGEGLFAKKYFVAGDLVSYFGGVKSFRREFWARNRTEEEIRKDFTHLIGIADDEETGEEMSKNFFLLPKFQFSKDWPQLSLN